MDGLGILAALLSSALGGTAIVATRYLAGTLDPLTIGAVRFAGGFLVLMIVALRERDKWPKGRDWLGVAALGLLFFGLFPVLFNAALIYTTAARGALALSTLPLLTMIAGALLSVEPLTARKAAGVLIAMAGVAVALATSLTEVPSGAWRGDMLMVTAACCMALYNVWSRPLISRSAPIPFAAFGMGIGATCLLTLSVVGGGVSGLVAMNPTQWTAAGYLAIICGALIFFLWAFALGRTTPTLVAISVAVNPVTAALFAVLLLDEPLSTSLIVGLIGVCLGIGIASGVSLQSMLGRRRSSPRR
ncbi:DMT family transporter [Mesorhizobium sp. CCNWLW179-1]|uniref:DMT family transporter n=1 Tax=unclassified Mesorhizobium TaxID=325217 RepID=UPI003014C84B